MTTEQMLSFVPRSEFIRVQETVKNPYSQSSLLAYMCRVNALYAIMRAGSGHIGTSFSCIDILTWLWTQHMRNPNEDGGDVFFSSKGHDAPALYGLLTGLGLMEFDLIHKLRRLDGLPGHPDVTHTPYAVANTGSLGMGISKAMGMVLADRLSGVRRNYYVLTGDGELQEGQIWESLQPVANAGMGEITVIVDANKMQSDAPVARVSDLGLLAEKFESFGWEVDQCDGHDLPLLEKIFAYLHMIQDVPKVLIADTVKGKGVSFMEQLGNDGWYKYHAGAPTYNEYVCALYELVEKINALLETVLALPALHLETLPMPSRDVLIAPQKLVSAYGDELVKIGKEHDDVVVLDADLIKSCGLIPFSKEFPERFIECGIAEQHMVSVAGGLALRGKIPVVHSLACFLSPRPNEQIYANATEKTKIIYVGVQAGLLPAGPGHSHQAVRDISVLGSIPGMTLIEPCNEQETRMAIRWAVEQNPESTYIRLVSVPTDISYELPGEYSLQKGRGVFLRDGDDIVIVAYGPTMLMEAMGARALLAVQGISAAVYNMPWLNEIGDEMLRDISLYSLVVTLDDHYIKLGQGEQIAARVGAQHMLCFGVGAIPACGQGAEVLHYHHLDAESIAQKVRSVLPVE